VSEPRSKWFRLSEWNSRHRLATPYPPTWVESRWRPLAETLDVIRDEAGCAITISPNGGFRNYDHNRDIGGAPNSQHPKGRAADLRCRKLSPKQLYALILRLHAAGKLPRLGAVGLYSWGVHVDIRPSATLVTWDRSGDEFEQTA